ncbi:MAG: DUF2339 domain-containing protein, partial [bacterium]|nr:DUF2339 domain-containing protein [bacterium]
MGGLFGLFLILVAAVLAGPVIAIVALVRFSGLQRTHYLLEKRVLRTELELERMRRSGAASAADESAPIQSAPVVATPTPVAPRRQPPPQPQPQPRQPSRKPSPSPAVGVDWERWIGIRGAAVVGAVALGLAGLLFFKYSIEHELISPLMRVVLGTLAGLGCIVGSEWLRIRKYAHTAEGIAGAGVVILYAAFWAAHMLYDLIPMLVAFGLMALVTATCCMLAVRRDALIVAVLGLVGGFATPLLLSSGTDRPIGLFGYVLLLDLGLLAVGQKRRWPSLGVLSLLGTVLMQALWIGDRMGPERIFLGLAILVVFGALFVFSAPAGARRDLRDPWVLTQLGGVMFPFAFALYFASRVELGVHLWPIGILLALLSAAACWLARRQQVHPIGVGAAAASVAIAGVWRLQHPPAALGIAWELVAVAIGLSALFHVFVERDRERSDVDGPAAASLIASGGFFVLLLSAVPAGPVPIWPWVLGWGVLAALTCRHARFPGRAWLQPVAAAGVGVGLTSLHQLSSSVLPSSWLFLALLVAPTLVFLAPAMARSRLGSADLSRIAAFVLPVVLLAGLGISDFTSSLTPLAALGTATLLGALAALAATRSENGAAYFGAVGVTVAAHLSWIVGRSGLHDAPHGEALTALLLGLATVSIFTFWPLLAADRFSTGRGAWYGAAVAGPLFFLPMRHLFDLRFGDDFIGILPVVLGALAMIAALRLRTALPGDGVRRSALVWFAAVALCFFAIAIPLQLEKEWVTLGWALQGFAVLALWRRLDHPGLKYFGLALLGAASVRLVANDAILT